MTYNEAYNKIIDAYFKDDIKPYEANFCFCGTLNGNDSSWFNSLDKNNGVNYTHNQLKQMENVFLLTINSHTIKTGEKLPDWENDYKKVLLHPNYEEALFKGMCAALEVLKQIHIERGEDVEEKIFTKRIKTAI